MHRIAILLLENILIYFIPQWENYYWSKLFYYNNFFPTSISASHWNSWKEKLVHFLSSRISATLAAMSAVSAGVADICIVIVITSHCQCWCSAHILEVKIVDPVWS